MWFLWQSDHKYQSYDHNSSSPCKFVERIDKNEFTAAMKHCYLMWKNSLQAKQFIENCYKDIIHRKLPFANAMPI